MVARGERIGTAYIKILADGSEVDRGIEESFADSDAIAEKYGRTNAEAYEKGYGDQANKNDTFSETFDRKMQRLRGQFDAMGRIHAQEYEERFTREFRALFLQRDIFEGPDQDEKASKAGEHAGRLWAEHFAKTGKPDIDFGVLFRDALKEMDLEADELARSLEKANKVIKDTDRDSGKFGRTFSNTIGRAFGKGSRNDALNFFGSIVGGLATIGTSLINLGGFAEKFSTILGEAFQSLGKKMGMSEEAIAMFGEMATSGAVAGATIGAIIILLGPVASLISGLAAAVTALAASVSFALAAGLGVFVGLLPLLAGGVVATIMAFKGLDEIKGGNAVLKDLKGSFTDMRKELAEGALPGIKDFSKGFGNMMDQLSKSGAIKDIGKAIGTVFSQMGKFVNSKAFQDFLGAFMEALPGAIRAVGRIGRNMFSGFGAVFEAVLPMVQDFLGWLAGVTGEFARWAQAHPGKIQAFFEKAADSAQTLGKFIGKVGEAIGKLLFSDEGKKAGDTMFKGMTDAVVDFVDFIRKAQKNGDLEKWFDNGVEVGKQLGEAVKGILRLLDELDTPENRDLMVAIFESIGSAASIFTDTMRILQPIIAPLVPLIEIFAGWLGGIAGAFNTAADGITGFFDLMADAFNSGPVQTFIDWMGKLITVVSKFMDPINTAIDLAVAAFQKLWDFLFGNSIIPDMIDGFEKFFDFMAKGWNFIGGTVKKVVNWFKGLGENVGKAMNKVGDWIKKGINFIKDLPSKIKTFLERAHDFFAALPGKIWNALQKAWDKVQSFIERVRDNLPSKMKDAIDRVVNFFKDLPGKAWDALTNAISRIGDFVTRARDKFADFVTAARDKAQDAYDAIKTWVGKIPDAITSLGTKMYNAAKGLGGKFLDGIGAGLRAAGGIASDIGAGIESVINGMIDQINNLLEFDFKVKGIGFKVDAPDIGHVNLAQGGIVTSPTLAMVGEAGPEAVVPLSRSLAAVDPSVRQLSGIAQRQSMAGLQTAPSAGRSIDVGGITVITPTKDPVGVAQETINRMVSSTYF